MAPTVELPHPFTDIDVYLKHLVGFLESHSWLFRNHVVDFVTLDHWQHMPAQWRRPLLECSTGELLCLPVGVCPARADAPVEDGGWPESLVEFIRGASKLALPRVPARDQPKAPAGDDGSHTGLECLGSEPGMELAAHKHSSALSKALSRGMKAKKRHEVERLGVLVASLCERLGCRTVVDFGAGQGYLGQLLHFGYGLRVVAIDSSAHQTHGADRRAARVKKALTRRPTALPPQVPTVTQSPRSQSEKVAPPITVDTSTLFLEETAEISSSPSLCLPTSAPAPAPILSTLPSQQLSAEIPADAVCHGCGVSSNGTSELKPCTLCGEVFYCSKVCQKLGWKKLKHKVHCKGMAAHRAAAALEKAEREAARAAKERASIPTMGAGEHGVYSITCLLDQRLTTLPSLLSSQPAAVTKAATDEGDLTPSMLRVFGKPSAWSSDNAASSGWGQPAAIVNVGCCYHLLTEADDRGKVGSDGRSAPDLSDTSAGGGSKHARDEEDGFPLSKRVASLGLSLGIGARMLACQAVERWPTKGEVESSNLGERAAPANNTEDHVDVLSQKLGEADLMFRKHFYRGVLQCVLEERFPKKRPERGKKDDEASKNETEETAAGGPPSETMQGNRETGWKVGAQRKVAAVAGVRSAENSTSSLPNADVDSGEGVVGDVGEGGMVRVSDSSTSLAAEQSPRQSQGKGKSWDQVVNAKVRSGSFASYAAAALQRLGLEAQVSAGAVTAAELEQYERQHSHRQQEIAVFWTVRAVMAPLVEGLLLLDRMLYLHDECNCGDAALLPLFDPEVSPRSFVVVGTKQRT